jgi:predicted phosphohydrolase
MRIFAISDLHLNGNRDKPMSIFGEYWLNHTSKLITNWNNKVSKKDMVLIPGDISWAMKWEEVLGDLELLHNLPGKKIFVRGNHDYWWQKISRLNSLYNDMFFILNKAYMCDEIAVCGTRGWICPGKDGFTANDSKIYHRELLRLKLSLDDAMNNHAKEIIVMLHYPPTNEGAFSSAFTELFEQYPVSYVIYGHLHDKHAWGKNIKGKVGNIIYRLVSADYLEFMPIEIKC